MSAKGIVLGCVLASLMALALLSGVSLAALDPAVGAVAGPDGPRLPVPPKQAPEAGPSAGLAIEGHPIGPVFPIHDPPGTINHVRPSIAYNPDLKEYLVVWQNERPVYPDIEAQRVSRSGALVGGPFFISGGEGVKRRNPDVTYNSKQQEYLIVWEHEPDGARPNIMARRVSGTGEMRSGELPLGTGPALRLRTRPAIAYAWTSDRYMVVWESLVQGASSSDIEAQVLSAWAALEGSNFQIATGSTNHSYEDPDLAYNRSRNEYLVAWTWHDKVGPNYDIKARRVTQDGILLDSELLIGYHTPDEWHPAVHALPTVPNAGKYLVVWELRYTASDGDIYSREVSGPGVMGAVKIISSLNEDQTDPAVAGSEERGEYMTAWVQDAGSIFDDIKGRIFSGGEPTGPLFSLLGGWTYPKLPAVASGPDGDFLVAFQDAPWTGIFGIYGRLWGDRRYTYLPLTLR